MAKLFNLARMTTATTGTGTLNLGSAVSAYLTFAQAGVSDGDIVSYGVKDGSNSEIGTGTYTTVGTTLTRNVTKSTNSNTAISLSGTAEVFITPRAEDLVIPQGHLAGLALSTAGSSATFTVAAGLAVNSTNTDFMVLGAACAKTTSSWAVGSGNGGLDTGSIANSTWYHAYLIKRPDTGVVDVIVSTSASAPTLPTNYTLYRRIGSLLTNGSAQWVKFLQTGDFFLWDVPVQDYTAVSVSTSGGALTLTVPNGIVIDALFNAVMASNTVGIGVIYHPMDISSQVVNTPTANYMLSIVVANTGTGGQFRVRTNTGKQIRAVSNATSQSCDNYISTQGWVDRRGRD